MCKSCNIIFRSVLLFSISNSGIVSDEFLLINGCLLIQVNSSAIFFGESTKSTTPSSIADFGMLINLAESSCAKVIPPANFISFKPRVPSYALPESIIPITFSLCVSANEVKSMSMEIAEPLSTRGINLICPSVTSIPLL